MNIAKHDKRQFIGSGRSAKVYLSCSNGREVATKVFTGEKVSKFILFVLTGSANPYTWCKPAVQCAIARRKVLTILCQHWFGSGLSLPEVYGYRWNPGQKAYEIDMEFVPGRHASLLSPLRENQVDLAQELRRKVMDPLQARLVESGFDGAVWQAGKGNPVAESNFMILDEEDGYHWVWIDLESGLPALFALNPLSTLLYYIPMCFKHRRWLFDDVDCEKLRSYVDENCTELSPGQRDELRGEIDDLERSQRDWKQTSRHLASLNYARSQAHINDQQQQYFLDRPIRWFAVSVSRGLVSVVSGAGRLVLDCLAAIRNFNYQKLGKRIIKYASNSYYRWGVIRWFVRREIFLWERRGFLDQVERDVLLAELHDDEISAYLTDFSIHIGVKPFIKVFIWGFLPLLIAAGSVGFGTAALVILWTGPVVRTVYTLWRMVASMLRSRPHYPWVALFVGILPMLGNLAYPMEILYQSAGRGNVLGKFMTCAFSARIGSKIPVWGGRDTGTEHFFNRIGHRITAIQFRARTMG